MRKPHFIDYFLYGWVTCLLVKLHRGDDSMNMPFIVAVFAFCLGSVSWVLTLLVFKLSLIGFFSFQVCWNFNPLAGVFYHCLWSIWVDKILCVENSLILYHSLGLFFGGPISQESLVLLFWWVHQYNKRHSNFFFLHPLPLPLLFFFFSSFSFLPTLLLLPSFFFFFF